MTPFTRIVALCALLFVSGCTNSQQPIANPPLKATAERKLGDFTVPVWQVTFSPDGRLLAGAAADGTVTLWTWPEGSIARTVKHPVGATGAAFSPDGARIASAGYDGTVKVWRVADGALERTLAGHERTVWSVAFSPKGDRIASSGEDKTVRIWNATDGTLLHTLKGHELNVWSVRFSPDGARVASGSFDHDAKVWRVADGGLERTLVGHAEAIVEVAFSHDGELLVTGGDDSRVRAWRKDGTLAHVLEGGSDHVYTVAVSPDSRWIASGGREKGAVGTLIKQVAGRIGKPDPTVRLWRAADGALLQLLADADDDVHSLAFSPDGRWLVASGAGRTIQAWRLANMIGE